LEIEAKFSIPDEQTFRQLLEAPTLADFSLGEASVSELYDQYLDTADGAFFAAGFACRIRRWGQRYLATLKSLGSAQGAMHRRVECEIELPLPAHPRDWPRCAARDLALRLCDDRPLHLLLEIEQTRHTRAVFDRNRTIAELDLDRVRVCHSGDVVASHLELEAELLREGDEGALQQIATYLRDVWHLVPETASKFARGLALVGKGSASA